MCRDIKALPSLLYICFFTHSDTSSYKAIASFCWILTIHSVLYPVGRDIVCTRHEITKGNSSLWLWISVIYRLAVNLHFYNALVSKYWGEKTQQLNSWWKLAFVLYCLWVNLTPREIQFPYIHFSGRNFFFFLFMWWFVGMVGYNSGKCCFLYLIFFLGFFFILQEMKLSYSRWSQTRPELRKGVRDLIWVWILRKNSSNSSNWTGMMWVVGVEINSVEGLAWPLWGV